MDQPVLFFIHVGEMAEVGHNGQRTVTDSGLGPETCASEVGP